MILLPNFLTWSVIPPARGGYRGGQRAICPPWPSPGGAIAPPGVFGKEKSTGTNIGKSPITDNHFHLILLE